MEESLSVSGVYSLVVTKIFNKLDHVLSLLADSYCNSAINQGEKAFDVKKAADGKIIIEQWDYTVKTVVDILRVSFRHGLRPPGFFSRTPSAFWPIIKAISSNELVLQTKVLEKANPNLNTHRDRENIWLGLVLSEGSLINYLTTLTQNQKLLKSFYSQNAILHDPAAVNKLQRIVQKLNQLFSFQLTPQGYNEFLIAHGIEKAESVRLSASPKSFQKPYISEREANNSTNSLTVPGVQANVSRRETPASHVTSNQPIDYGSALADFQGIALGITPTVSVQSIEHPNATVTIPNYSSELALGQNDEESDNSALPYYQVSYEEQSTINDNSALEKKSVKSQTGSLSLSLSSVKSPALAPSPGSSPSLRSSPLLESSSSLEPSPSLGSSIKSKSSKAPSPVASASQTGSPEGYSHSPLNRKTPSIAFSTSSSTITSSSYIDFEDEIGTQSSVDSELGFFGITAATTRPLILKARGIMTFLASAVHLRPDSPTLRKTLAHSIVSHEMSQLDQLAEREEFMVSSTLELHICPVLGLDSQNFLCAGCNSNIAPEAGTTARLCDHTGKFFCTTCHSDQLLPSPARIVHNWDFKPRPVSNGAAELYTQQAKTQLVNLESLNPRLFELVEDLGRIKHIRQQLVLTDEILQRCHGSEANALKETIRDRPHFLTTLNLYTIDDLLQVHEGTLLPFLTDYLNKVSEHILKSGCINCQVAGSYCQYCKSDLPIFPFQIEQTIICPECNLLSHASCVSGDCPKCRRIAGILRPSSAQQSAVSSVD